MQHLINYPAALIQYRLKHNGPELPANLNKFNLFESRAGGFSGNDPVSAVQQTDGLEPPA